MLVAVIIETTYYLLEKRGKKLLVKGYIVKKLVCLFFASLLVVSSALASSRYISDNLFTYMHSGPSNQFRIIGSIDAGDKVTLLEENQDTGYTQIQDSEGRKGWVESRFVTTRESISIRLPKLEKELESVKEKLV